MKICVLTTSFPRYAKGDGAHGNFVFSLVRALSETCEVTLVAPHAPGSKTREIFGGITVIRFRYFFPARLEHLAYGEKGIIENLKFNYFLILQIPFFLFFFLLKTWQVSKNCDLIHANWIISGAIALVVKFLRKTPVVLTVHNTRLRHFPRWLTRYVVKKVDTVISPHPELTDIVQSFGKKQVVEIPNMIDFDTHATPADISQLRREFGIKDEMVITFVARLVAWKDPRTFIMSIPYVIRELRHVKFLVVGGGPLENELRQTVKDLGIQKHVVITGRRNDVGSILAISDVFVALSTIENIWSVTIVEAMNADIPCIITRAGSTEKILTHLETAYLIPPADRRGLAKGIVRLFGDDALRATLSQQAKNLIQKSGVVKKDIILKTLDLYNQMTKGFNYE